MSGRPTAVRRRPNPSSPCKSRVASFPPKCCRLSLRERAAAFAERRATLWTVLLCFHAANGADRHVGNRHLLVVAHVSGRHVPDLVHDIHPLGDAAEHGVSWFAGTAIEAVIVLDVDKKLIGGAVRVIGACHGEG